MFINYNSQTMKKASAFLRTPLAKTFAVLAICLGFSLFGFSIAFGYGGGGGGGGSSSNFITSITAIDVPLTINGTQAGTLTYNVGGDDSVHIVIPANSFTGSATFKVVGSSLGDFSPTNGSAIGGGVYMISATDANNNSVTNFNNNLTITFSGLSLPADVSNVGVYFLNETTNEWVLIPGSIIDPAAGTVVFIINHFTKFAVLNVPGTPATVKTSITKVATTATPVVTAVPLSNIQVDGLAIKFRAGLSAKQMAGITNLVNSGRLFSEVDAKNYAWAIGVSNWQQYVGKNPKTTAVSSAYTFTRFLTVGSIGDEVRALQRKLAELGYFDHAVTGYFGSVTKAAVVEFQKAHDLTPYPGYVGPGTRAALNK